ERSFRGRFGPERVASARPNSLQTLGEAAAALGAKANAGCGTYGRNGPDRPGAGPCLCAIMAINMIDILAQFFLQQRGNFPAQSVLRAMKQELLLGGTIFPKILVGGGIQPTEQRRFLGNHIMSEARPATSSLAHINSSWLSLVKTKSGKVLP